MKKTLAMLLEVLMLMGMLAVPAEITGALPGSLNLYRVHYDGIHVVRRSRAVPSGSRT